MTEEGKAIDRMKEVAELEEIPAGVEFNQARAWAKIQMGLEKQRASRLPLRVIIFILALVIVITGVVIAVRLMYRSGDMVPEPKKTSYVDKEGFTQRR